jgi:light-regulated signal transduction histidine kinase (bacteriophytochrome)
VAEVDLQKSSENIKRFAYSISHDLKNPAIALHGLTRLLEKKYGEKLDEKGKAFCTQIINITAHITLLVDNINSLITTKEMPFNFENINLHESCSLIREEFAAQLNKRRITWLEPQLLPLVKADRLSILRILRNFVDNALKYGGEKLSEIEIGYQHSENTHILSVRDDGKGFKEGEEENMFRVFSRNTTSGDITGTGLGLAIVKEIAEKHGGNAWAESTLGQGATFYISISKNLK